MKNLSNESLKREIESLTPKKTPYPEFFFKKKKDVPVLVPGDWYKFSCFDYNILYQVKETRIKREYYEGKYYYMIEISLSDSTIYEEFKCDIIGKLRNKFYNSCKDGRLSGNSDFVWLYNSDTITPIENPELFLEFKSLKDQVAKLTQLLQSEIDENKRKSTHIKNIETELQSELKNSFVRSKPVEVVKYVEKERLSSDDSLSCAAKYMGEHLRAKNNLDNYDTSWFTERKPVSERLTTVDRIYQPNKGADFD